MHFPTPGIDGDQSLRNEVAKDEGNGKGLETKDVLTFQPSKSSTCPVMKIGPIAGHQMISPLLFSHCRCHSVLFDCCSNKIMNLLFPWAFSFIFSFKTGLSKFFCIWSHFVHDVLFLYLIKKVAPFTLWISSSSAIIISWSGVLLAFPSMGLRIDATDNSEKLSP